MNNLQHKERVKEIKVGDVVKAIAGRDCEKLFVVAEVVDTNYIKIADGKSRSIKKPKLKKVKHIRMTEWHLQEIAKKLSSKKAIGDKVLAKALSELTNNP